MAIIHVGPMGPFLIPFQTCNGNPVTHLFFSFANQTRRTLRATLTIHQAFSVATPPGPTTPQSPIHDYTTY
ncbi:MULTISPECIES: hypothetical protein [Brevibacillus]|uniref:hypothetical protein n=1 Tax=Brevibacillus TaxID=55080 RepID=UPI000B9B93B2|nr:MULTISPECIES: hypothetical protein [Brevibacillus]